MASSRSDYDAMRSARQQRSADDPRASPSQSPIRDLPEWQRPPSTEHTVDRHAPESESNTTCTRCWQCFTGGIPDRMRQPSRLPVTDVPSPLTYATATVLKTRCTPKTLGYVP